MFEYLMPHLVMPGFENTLLDQTPQGCRPATEKLRQKTRRSMGHLRIGLLCFRCTTQLPISCFWCTGTGIETRTCRRSGYRPVCHDAGCDGGTGNLLLKISWNSMKKASNGQYGLFASHRLHAGTPHTWTELRDCPVIYGPSSRNGFSGTGDRILLDLPDASSFRGREYPWFQTTLPLSARKNTQNGRLTDERTSQFCRKRRWRLSLPKCRPGSTPTSPDTRIPERATVIKRFLSRHGHPVRRWLQPLEGLLP